MHFKAVYKKSHPQHPNHRKNAYKCFFVSSKTYNISFSISINNFIIYKQIQSRAN